MTASAVEAAPCRIFISYRRDDSAGWAGRLASDLQERLGQQTVFQDVATIEAGEDFVAAITRVLQTCAVALVVIGPDWRDIRDEQGAPRLENPQDLVRLEIATALRRQGLRVVPVLVGGATMPDGQELPADLRDLAKRHAFDLSDTRWDYDIGRLADTLAKVAGLEVIGRPAAHRRGVSRPLAIAGAAALIVAAAIAMYALLWRDHPSPSPGPLGEFSIDRPTAQQLIPLGAAQTWMLEGRFGSGFAEERAVPRIEVEVFKLPERREIAQDGRVRLSTETGFWRFESARFDGAGPYEVIVTVSLGNRSDFKSVKVECLPKSDAFRRTIDAERQRRGVPRIAVGVEPSTGGAGGRAGAVLP
ncbi:MAG: toll/interleukin-1 receptor domain-containing protein, partial [Vicinamibacterales bacterium]